MMTAVNDAGLNRRLYADKADLQTI